MRILIADDEEYIRYDLRSLIEELIPRAQVYEAVNGREAAELCREISFHLAFIDIQMPGISGLEFLEKEEEALKRTIKIILSGYSDFEYARRSLGLGVREYLLKPLTKEDLTTLLHKLSLIPAAIKGGDECTSLVIDAEKIIFRRFRQSIGVAQVAEDLGVSPNYLSSQFKKQKGMKLTDYITTLRLETAKEMLLLPGSVVKNISSDLGYQSCRHFSRLFREKYGLSPSVYKEECRKGSLIVDSDPRGILEFTGKIP